MKRRRSRTASGALRSPGAPRQAPARHDSIADAAAWLDAVLGTDPLPALLVAIGAGEGHLLDVLERRSSNARVLVLEPNRAAATAFLARRDWSRWRDSGRLAYLVGPDYAGADQAWRVFPQAHDALKLLVHPALAQDRHGLLGALQVLKRIQFGVKSNLEARRRFAPRYLANVIRNVPAISAGHDVRALAGAYRGVPAVIAAAGPSLDTAIDDLHAVSGRALSIAVDTALRPLLHAGLTPHLVVGADPGAANARHFHALPDCAGTWLVSESALARSATSLFDGRTFWFRLAKHHPWPWLHEIGIDVGVVEMWGSVLTAAFQVAYLAGCDPIVMVGADLALTGGRPYCRGTTYEFDWANATSSGNTLDEVWATQVSRYSAVRAPDLAGRETLTTASMRSFRDWILAASIRSGRRVINATGGGTLFGDGIEQMPLLAALPEADAVPPVDSLVRMPTSGVEPKDVAQRFREVQESLTTTGTASAPLADWAAFLGEGYDPSAIGAAIAESLNEIDGAERRGATRAAIDWSPAHTRRLLTQLPESLAGFRSALAATHSRAAETEAHGPDRPLEAREHRERSALLMDAFALLHTVCQEARQLPRLRLTEKPAQIGRVPVSAMFAWPDAVRWPVELFEAMLQRAWPAADATGPSSFATRRVRLRDAAAAPDDTRLVPAPHDCATQACALLILEWLRCASEPSTDMTGIVTATTQALAAMAAAAASKTAQAAATLSITLQVATSLDRIELDVPVAAAAFAKQLTGTLGDLEAVSHELACAASDLFRVSFVLQPLATERRTGPAGVESKRPAVVPRVLTDEGVAGALVVYRSGAGIVCVSFQRDESILVLPDGSVRSHHRWPRPIVNELPFGDSGAVAWGDGLSGFPDRVTPGYVMYRADSESEPIVQELPVRPTVGRWWQGRLYWNCHPRRVESPTGLVSWAPGEETPRWELPDLPATLGIHSHEEGLTFEPGGGPLQGGRWRRRFERRGWSWRPGGELQPIQLGSYGLAAARDVWRDWTATAHPEADLVRLESAAGRAVTLACYYPIGLGWLEGSLLVGTIEQELLLFEHLSTHLHAVRV